jgi:ATP-dependent protease ClpP protease subunit
MAAAELVIGGVITTMAWSSSDITSASVRRWLSENAKAKEVVVRLNSPGGDAFEGVAIYSMLKRHDARIVAEVEGLAASAASVVLMAADEIRVHQGAQVMIHKASCMAWGDADMFRAEADRLDKINVEVAEIYAARTGKSSEEILGLMSDETWMGGKDAVSMGFADKVIPAKGKPQAQQSARAQAMLSMYKRAPQSLIEQPRHAQLSAGRTPLGELARAPSRIGGPSR